MTNPPEVGASHPISVWYTKKNAEQAADDVMFGYVKELPIKPDIATVDIDQ